MTALEINKNVMKHHKKKVLFVLLLLSFLLITVISAITYTFIRLEFLGKIGIVSYIFLIAIVFIAAATSHEEYKLEVSKTDICEVLSCIESFSGSVNEFSDMLYVFRWTADRMIHSHNMNWGTSDQDEKVINEAWNQLYHYLSKENNIVINRKATKEFSAVLLDGIHNRDIEIRYEQIEKMINTQVAEKLVLNIPPIHWNVVIVILCTIVLFSLLAFKFVIVLNPKLSYIIEAHIICRIIYQTGSDIIAFAFALFAVRAELSEK